MMRLLLSSIAILTLGGCQHASERVDAMLADNEPETIDALKAGLGDAMGRTFIELGASDPAEQSVVSVLPLPLSETDDRSLERPTLFDLVLDDGICVAINRETGQETRLANVPCRPA